MDDKDTKMLLGQIFALITARFEDGAGLAFEGQNRSGETDAVIDALQTCANDIIVLLDAVSAVRRMAD